MDERERIAALIAKYQNIMLRMSIRITAYYIVMAALLAMAAYFVPGFSDHLPLGGVTVTRPAVSSITMS